MQNLVDFLNDISNTAFDNNNNNNNNNNNSVNINIKLY